jgi:hypothetical protein
MHDGVLKHSQFKKKLCALAHWFNYVENRKDIWEMLFNPSMAASVYCTDI